MFNSKKGAVIDILMHPAFITFVAVLVLLYLLWFVNGLGSDLTFEKKYLATDIALTMDSLLASRDNVVLYYLPQRKEFNPKFNYDFKKNRITVYQESKPESSAGKYFFTSDPSIKLKEITLSFKPPFVLPRFAKIGNKILVDDVHDPKHNINILLLSCPEKKFEYGNITLDPGHGFNEDLNQGSEGFTTNKLKEYVLTREISSIAKILDTYQFLGDLTRDSDIDLSIDDRRTRIQDSLISVHVGSYSNFDNIIKAYVNYDSYAQKASLKLACELVNEVSSALIDKKIKITGIAVIPVIPAQKSDKEFSILVQDKPAVMLEIGNINVPDTFSQENKKAIASAIIEGIKNAQK